MFPSPKKPGPLKAIHPATCGARTTQHTSELDPERQAPFLYIIQQAACGEKDPPGDKLERMCALTVGLVAHLEQKVRRVDFWRNNYAQDVLRSEILRLLDERNLVPFGKQERLADQIMDMARRRRHLLGAVQNQT